MAKLNGLKLWLHPEPELQNSSHCNFVITWNKTEEGYPFTNIYEGDYSISYMTRSAAVSLRKMGWTVIWQSR